MKKVAGFMINIINAFESYRNLKIFWHPSCDRDSSDYAIQTFCRRLNTIHSLPSAELLQVSNFSTSDDEKKYLRQFDGSSIA